MPVLFISDIHLSENEPTLTEAFITLLHKAQTQAESVYILGDLFERWIGDDDHPTWHAPIIEALRSVSQAIPCYFMAGNRDFLIGPHFCERTGLTLLQEPALIDLYGRKTVLMHGDVLCTDDKKYLAYRVKSRRPEIIRRFLCLPLFCRQSIAALLRYLSQRHQKKQTVAILDANPGEILHQLRIYHADLLIHGHTHRPAIHWCRVGEQFKQWIVLGDWHNGQYSVLWADKEHLELVIEKYSV